MSEALQATIGVDRQATVECERSGQDLLPGGTPLGEAEVLETFKVPKIGLIAGCAVRSGVIRRDGRVRIIRDSVEVYEGTIHSLRRFKDDVKEVRQGFECGMSIKNFNDIVEGDQFEVFEVTEVARSL